MSTSPDTLGLPGTLSAPRPVAGCQLFPLSSRWLPWQQQVAGLSVQVHRARFVS